MAPTGADAGSLVRETLRKHKAEIEALLPRQIPYARLEQTVVTSVRETPRLLEVTRSKTGLTSIIQAACQAAIVGLEPGRLLDLAYISARQDRDLGWIAEFQTTYKGDIRLLYASGSVKNIYADVVYGKDKFALRQGTHREIIHEPALESDRGPMIGAYAVAELTTGAVDMEWMPVEEIDQVAAMSRRQADSAGSPWNSWRGEMAKKSVLRRLMKRLPVADYTLRLLAQDQSSPFSMPAAEALTDLEESVSETAAPTALAAEPEPEKATEKAPEPTPELPEIGDAETRPEPEASTSVADTPAAEAPKSTPRTTLASPQQVALLKRKVSQTGVDPEKWLATKHKLTFDALTEDQWRELIRGVNDYLAKKQTAQPVHSV